MIVLHCGVYFYKACVVYKNYVTSVASLNYQIPDEFYLFIVF